MEQTSLQQFFGKENEKSKKEETFPNVQGKHTKLLPEEEEEEEEEEESLQEEHKKSYESKQPEKSVEKSKEHILRNTTAATPASYKRKRESTNENLSSESNNIIENKHERKEYDFDKFKDEFMTLLKSYDKPTATSMAKLLIASPFDAYTKFEKVWPRPLLINDNNSNNNNNNNSDDNDNVYNISSTRNKGKDNFDSVPYAAVVDVLADISATNSRLSCIHHLTDLLRAILIRCPEDFMLVIYLVINKQAPPHEGIELGVGDALLMKVIAESCGMTEQRVRKAYKQSGDLAEIAQDNRQTQSTLLKPRPLLARDVFNGFREIARMNGKDVMRRRADVMKRLLTNARGAEVNLIVRALQQQMRIGLAEPSALTSAGYALALHFLGPATIHKLSVEDVQIALTIGASGFARFYHEVPSLEVVCAAVLKHGYMLLVPHSSVAVANARELSIRPGLPVKPQLAHPTSGISVILNRLQGKRFTSEYKYDGERAQIHYSKSSGFHLFSRNAETHTGKYPDVLAMLPLLFDSAVVHSFIIDSEIVAINPDTGVLQPFQTLQHRGRKNIEIENVSIPVCVFAFDLLYFNDEPLLSRTLAERRVILWKHFNRIDRKFTFATHLDSDNVEDIQKFLEQSMADGCEGLMIKTLDEEASYTPAKRSHYWLKLKKDYMDGVTDTFDLVPIAGYFGRGKRTGVYGSFLLACYDPDNDEFQSVTRTFTGLTDEQLEQVTHELQSTLLPSKPHYYRAVTEGVDVWFSPTVVWEIKAADLSLSPTHFAAIGMIEENRGISLRFPRYIRTRTDKAPTDCTTAAQIADMYRAQSLVQMEQNALQSARAAGQTSTDNKNSNNKKEENTAETDANNDTEEAENALDEVLPSDSDDEKSDNA